MATTNLNLKNVWYLKHTALWKFYFKLMNNKLPPILKNMKPVLPRICDNYGIRSPSFHLPLIKHVFAEQLLSYQLKKCLMKMAV